MKFPHPLRTARTGLVLSALLLCLTACLPESTPAPSPPPSETTAEADTTVEALRTYYESLIADLKQALLDEKQADYINRLDYEARITELESKLAALREQDENSPAGTDIPVSGKPLPLPPETAEPVETIAPTSSFHYVVEDGQITITAYRGTAREVAIPASITGIPVTCIGDNAFQNTAITTVTVPEGVTHIGWFAFAGCTSLVSVTLPASVVSIDYGAFEGCPHLTLRCHRGSYAADYAGSFALRVSYN